MGKHQGSQYCSPTFTTPLKRNGIIQSMSRAGTPHDNAVIESFFGLFKEKLNLDFHFKQSRISLKFVLKLSKLFWVSPPIITP